MSQLEVAHAFGRPDVDDFMEEVDAEQWGEWEAYFTLRPVGFRAMVMQTSRIAWAAIQPHVKKKLKERDFELKPAGHIHSDEEESARFLAYSIQTEVRERVLAMAAEMPGA